MLQTSLFLSSHSNVYFPIKSNTFEKNWFFSISLKIDKLICGKINAKVENVIEFALKPSFSMLHTNEKEIRFDEKYFVTKNWFCKFAEFEYTFKCKTGSFKRMTDIIDNDKNTKLPAI